MPHGRLTFTIDAPCEVVFDAFHHHEIRQRWDSLVKHPTLENGDEWPSVGAVTFNPGTGWTRFMSMRTRFINFDRPKLAAAIMVGRSFPFREWSASLKHLPLSSRQSQLIYVYNIKESWYLRGWAGWIVHAVFLHETRKRFFHLQRYLAGNAYEVEAWQAARQKMS